MEYQKQETFPTLVSKPKHWQPVPHHTTPGTGWVLVTIVIQANTGFCLSNNSPLPHCYRVHQGIGTTL